MKELVNKLIDLIDKRITFASFLVVSMIFISFALTIVIMFHEVPEKASSIIYGLVGGAWGYVGAIVQFKFGSSSGSERKDTALLNNQKS